MTTMPAYLFKQNMPALLQKKRFAQTAFMASTFPAMLKRCEH